MYDNGAGAPRLAGRAPAHSQEPCPAVFSGMTSIVFEGLHAGVRPPQRGTAGSAGYDLAAYLASRTVCVWREGVMHERPCMESDGAFSLTLAPGEKALVPLGFRARLPEGYEAQIRPRSGTSVKTDLVIANAPGTVDSDYPGEWCVPVKNGGASPLVIVHGDRIAQMVLARFEALEFTDGSVSRSTDRAGGFGSTG
jgi:dUTP pyrophosphatase